MSTSSFKWSTFIAKTTIRAFSFIPIKKKTILCNNFYDRGYDESPRAIVEELRKDKKYEIYWVISPNNPAKLPDGVKPVVIGTLKYLYLIATSKVLVSNVRVPAYFRKRKKQFYIQTWHGDFPLKKIEYDALDSLTDNYKKCMELDNKYANLFISSSNYFTNLIRNSFHYHGEVIESGSPKNDVLINSDHEEEKKIFKKELNISEDNTLLYMPTFRTDYSNDPFDIDLDAVKEALEKRDGKTWKVISKMHPNVKPENKKIHSKDYISIDNYGNTQRAIAACDLLITDYSSVFFDAILCNRPVFIYAKDEKEYVKKERGFYFNLSDLPFPIFYNTDEVVKYISTHDDKMNYKEFINKYKVACTGDASRIIADRIRKELE